MSPHGTEESPHATEAAIPRPLQPTMNQDTLSPFRQPQRAMANAVALGIMAAKSKIALNVASLSAVGFALPPSCQDPKEATAAKARTAPRPSSSRVK